MVHAMLYVMIALDVLGALLTVGMIGEKPETVRPGSAVFATVLCALMGLALYASYTRADAWSVRTVVLVLGALLLEGFGRTLYLVNRPRQVRTWPAALVSSLVNALEIGALLFVIAST